MKAQRQVYHIHKLDHSNFSLTHRVIQIISTLGSDVKQMF